MDELKPTFDKEFGKKAQARARPYLTPPTLTLCLLRRMQLALHWCKPVDAAQRRGRGAAGPATCRRRGGVPAEHAERTARRVMGGR